MSTKERKLDNEWECEICNSKFSASNELTYHYMNHSILELALALTNLQEIEKGFTPSRKDEVQTQSGIRTRKWQNNINLSEIRTENVEHKTNLIELGPEKVENKIDLSEHGKEKTEHKIDLSEHEQEKVENKVDLFEFELSNHSSSDVEELPKQTSKAKRRSKKDHQTLTFKCDVCYKVLSSKGNLKKHKVCHLKVKPFECKECNIVFNQVRDLKSHRMQAHTGERPHACKICGKGFVHKFYLKEHMDYHTGDRKWQCFKCGKQFQSSSTLSKHVQRHQTERPFSCPQCQKSFTVKVDLRSHIRLIHEKSGITGIPVFPAKSSKLKNSKV